MTGGCPTQATDGAASTLVCTPGPAGGGAVRAVSRRPCVHNPCWLMIKGPLQHGG